MEDARNRALEVASVLMAMKNSFRDAARLGDPLSWGELQTIDNCVAASYELLGDKHVVSPMITALQVAIQEAQDSLRPGNAATSNPTSNITFDFANRHIGPILNALEIKYKLAGYSDQRAILAPGKSSPVVIRITDPTD